MDDRLQRWLGAGTSALIVVDIQNDYIDPAGASAGSGQDLTTVVAMIPRLHRLIAAARDAGVPIYFTRNWHGPNTDSAAWKARRAGRSRSGGPAGMAGSWGADWYEIEPRPDEIVIDKYRYDAFLGTPLEMMLRARGCETVVCCGTATNVCVESTARSAHMRDFNLVLVEDCCAASDQALHEATLENTRRHFGVVTRAAEVEATWAGTRSLTEAG
jgi:ureidoacrylate peracid hydrolase